MSGGWDARAFPRELAEAEATRLARRRAGLADRVTAGEMEELARRHALGRYVGLALSGGGIRSATLSLGFIQSLARQGLLHQVDYLSTVSGGSYLGGFLGALFHRGARAARGDGGDDGRGGRGGRGGRDGDDGGGPPAWHVEQELDPASRSRVVEWLRDNGRYLAPGGASDSWAALAVILRNLVAVHAVLWTLVLTGFLLLDMARGAIVALLTRFGGAFVPRLLEHAAGSGAMWWSPALVLPALTVPLFLGPLGLAYWLIPESREERAPWSLRWIALLTSLGLLLFGVWLAAGGSGLGSSRGGARLAGALLVLEDAAAALALLIALRLGEPRYRLSRWLTAWLVVFCFLSAAGLLDSLGQTAYRALIEKDVRGVLVTSLVGGVTALLALGGGVRRVLGLLGIKTKRLGLPIQVIALVGAVILAVPMLVGVSAVGHGIVWSWQPRPLLGDPEVAWRQAGVAALLGIVLCACFGHTYSFLNGSSLASLYAARLTRAYLGASNKRRIDGDLVDRSSTETLPSDGIDTAVYSPESHGGPLHIINATLNETVLGQSQVEERDRKGMNLAFGPAGISVAAHHHAVWETEPDGQVRIPRARLRAAGRAQADRAGATDTEFHVFPRRTPQGDPQVGELSFRPEMLDLGRWIAISGAAASTALGSMTTLGLSLLCGLLNVRLGHWWWSDVDPHFRALQTRAGVLGRMRRRFSRFLPVQAHLVDELLARFPGTQSRNWYLTDGGHFENTGVYELIRRRMRVIILLDNGADPKTTFDDVANLVRKARVDFGVDITFDGAADPGDRFVGGLSDLGFSATKAHGPGRVKAYATIGAIEYPDGERGKLLLVKPGILDDEREPLDVLQYRAANPDFPQETTADQFFEEAQWEAYRKLGNHIGDAVLGSNVSALLARLLAG